MEILRTDGAKAPSAVRRFAHTAEQALLRVVEPIAAALILAEVCVLGAGVFSRYVLNAPIVWSDELASALFLWLAMLGAVIALGAASI